jgi:hypothetical protein
MQDDEIERQPALLQDTQNFQMITRFQKKKEKRTRKKEKKRNQAVGNTLLLRVCTSVAQTITCVRLK